MLEALQPVPVIPLRALPGQSGVVRDAIDKRGGQRSAPKRRGRPPKGEQQLLHQIVTIGALRKSVRHVMQHRGVFGQPALKAEMLLVVVHVRDLSVRCHEPAFLTPHLPAPRRSVDHDRRHRGALAPRAWRELSDGGPQCRPLVPFALDQFNLRRLRQTEIAQEQPPEQHFSRDGSHSGRILANTRKPPAIRILVQQRNAKIARHEHTLLGKPGHQLRDVGVVLMQHNDVGPMLRVPRRGPP